MGVKVRPPREDTDRSTMDRSNAGPICGDCGYRMLAADRYTWCCRHCGQIDLPHGRAVRMIIRTFGGKLTTGDDDDADR